MQRKCYVRLALFLISVLLFSSSPVWALTIKTKKDKNTGRPGKPIIINLSLTSAVEWHTFSRPNRPGADDNSPERAIHDDNYVDWINKLDFSIKYDKYSFGGRFDTIIFFEDRYPCNPSVKEVLKNYPGWYSFPTCKQAYIPEKLFFRYRHRRFKLTIGDHYLTIARGIGFLARKQDEFGEDTTVRGARIDVKNKGFKAVVSAGFINSANIDPVEEAFVIDPSDFVFAMDASQRFAKRFRLGANYVFIHAPRFVDAKSILEEDNRSFHIAGGYFQAKSLFKRKLDIYFSGNALNRPHIEDQELALGYAFYANINVYLFPFTLQVEGQYYRNYQIQAERRQLFQRYDSPDGRPEGSLAEAITPPLLYVNPPSMEDIFHDTQGQNDESQGARFRLDYTLPSKKTFFYVSYLFRQGWVPDNPIMVHHAMAGGEHRLSWWNISFYGGFRQVMNIEYWRRIHGQIDTTFVFKKKHSLKFFVDYSWNRKGEDPKFDPIPENISIEEYNKLMKERTELFETVTSVFQILDSQVSYSFAKWGSIALLFSYSNELGDDTARQARIKAGFKESIFPATIFPAVELKINIKPVGGALKLFYGKSRGGLRCVSGVCRTFPAFEGLRAEFQMRL